MRRAFAAALLIAATSAAGAAIALCGNGSECRRNTTKSAPAKTETKRFEPYDPDRARTGGRAGFVDVGGGTQLRVGGRTRFEYGVTR